MYQPCDDPLCRWEAHEPGAHDRRSGRLGPESPDEPEATRADILRTVALYAGTPTGCTLGDACDGCPQHDR